MYSAKEGSEEGESGYFMQVLKEIEGVKPSHIFFGQAVNTDTYHVKDLILLILLIK